MIALIIGGLAISILVAILIFGQAEKEEKERRERESYLKRLRENDEYDYGHDITHHIDGEGDL